MTFKSLYSDHRAPQSGGAGGTDAGSAETASCTSGYTGRVDLSYLKAVETQVSGANSGDDNHCLLPAANASEQRPRITKARLATIRGRLSERDLAVLSSLRQFRLATTEQLRLLHFADHASLASGGRVTRRVLGRLALQQLVLRLERRVGGLKAGSAGQIYALSPIGYRVLGERTRKRSWEPSRHHVEHTLAITDLAVRLRVAERLGAFSVEQLQTEPACWRSPAGIGSPKQVLKPDLHLVVVDQTTELSWFIEVDLATESTPVIQDKLATYSAYWRTRAEQQRQGVFPKVLWIAPTIERCDQIAAAITDGQRLGIETRLFDVALADQATQVLTDFAEPDSNQQRAA